MKLFTRIFNWLFGTDDFPSPSTQADAEYRRVADSYAAKGKVVERNNVAPGLTARQRWETRTGTESPTRTATSDTTGYNAYDPLNPLNPASPLYQATVSDYGSQPEPDCSPAPSSSDSSSSSHTCSSSDSYSSGSDSGSSYDSGSSGSSDSSSW